MAIQTMVSPEVIPSSGTNQSPLGDRVTKQAHLLRGRFLHRLAQVYWHVSFELEPVLKGFFSPFTVQIRHSRLLSNREKVELEAVMRKR